MRTIIGPVRLIPFLAFSILLAASGTGRTADPVPRPVPAKPPRTITGSGDLPDQIVLKLHEGTHARLRAGRWLGNLNGPALEASLRALGIDPGGVRRLFARPEEELDAERHTAQRRSGRDLADLNLYYHLSLPPGSALGPSCDSLNALEFVELAAPVPRPAPLPIDIAPLTPDLTSIQEYRSSAPEGIGIPDPSVVPGSDGTGTRVVDIEYSWVLDHEDLELDPSTNIDTATPDDPFPNDQGNHGTAVLGLLASIPNEYGVTGIVPSTQPLVAPAETAQFGYNVARAVNLASAVLQPGDAILIEQQTWVCGEQENEGCNGCGPIEWNQAAYDAISTATALGIVVVEAAGNGAADLDASGCQGRFDRNIRDSGAIIVGAGDPDLQSRLPFSSYGSRVDVQGWGRRVVTTGYGDWFGPGDVRQRYTGTFSGTSSASAMVTGAVLAVQGTAMAAGFLPLEPRVLRRLLVDTGTPQAAPADHIGPLPDVSAAVKALGPITAGQSIGGSKLVIKNAVPDNESRNRIVFVSRDPDIATGAPGSASDPRCGAGGGGSLSVFSSSTGQTFPQRLPCENWTLLGQETNPKGYKYLDRELDQGPCKVVLVKEGRLARALCIGKGPGVLDYDLTGASEPPIHVRITLGTGNLTHCSEFGGTVQRDGSDAKIFLARDAPRPVSCE
ncbi:MAG: S8 family serine peptidase [Myxococcota bacterium]